MDQLFMFSNEYTEDDDNNAKDGSNKEEAKIKSEPQEIVNDGEDDNSYIMPESLLQQMTTTREEDGEGEDDNTIFNFGIDQTAKTRSLSTIVKSTSTKNPQDALINYDMAIMYICPACGAEFDTQSVWKGHINGVHEYNTRRGLNFVPIDKLYHRCLECNKPIAMHAMENLLKHKFTHLPHRCTKCKICHRRYKYRQDLIVHLRLCHREEVILMMHSENTPVSRHESKRASVPAVTNAQLEIKDIKGNAVDIFENTSDSVEVKNEPFDPDDQDAESLLVQTGSKSKYPQTSILEDALSRSSSQVSEQRPSAEEKQCQKHIKYICPVCSTEFMTKNEWQEHVQEMHNFCTISGLGFQKRFNSTAECMECNRVLPDNSIDQLQQHKFSHLPCKTWLRCKLCLRSFITYKDIIKHLLNQHRLDDELDADMDDSQDCRSFDPYSAPSNDYEDDQALAEDQLKGDLRDIYETQIDYLCPKCGKEFFERKMWRKHIVKAHHYTDLKTLCFVAVNEHQLQCRLCGKVITNAYGVQNAQQHYFTHLPHKAYIRCRICTKSYTDRKGLVKHLRKVHHINPKTAAAAAAALAKANNKSIRPPLLATYENSSSSQMSRPRKAPVKEIVRHNGVIYEIQFLDEDSNDDTSFGGRNGDGRHDNSFAMPTRRHVCSDCYSTFATAQELQKHTREQHDFKKPTQANVCGRCYCTFESEQALQDHKQKHHSSNSNGGNGGNNDDDDLLLVPTGNEEVKMNTADDTPNIEQYFCYLCPACGEEFKTQYEWRRHINDIHYFDRRYELNFKQIDKFHFQCLECKEIVNSAKLKGLQDHKFRHLPYKLYIKCRLCSTCYNHKPNVVTHLCTQHNFAHPRKSSSSSPAISPAPQMRNTYNMQATTSNTFKPLSTESLISLHNAVEHETITYNCPQCNEPFDTHALWRQHIVTVHDLNSRQGLNFRQLDAHHYICLECYKRVTVTHTKGAIGQLQSHKFRHLPYKSFCCTKCGGVFVRKQMFFKHLNRATNRCPLMGNERATHLNVKTKSYYKNSVRNMYGQQSDDSKPLKNLNFSVTSNEKCPYIIQCPQCGIKFEKWHPWRDHIEKEHKLNSMESLKFKKINDHLHICIQCKERVNGANFVNLQTHRFKHLPYGTYLHCRYCDVRYYYMINIIKHMKQKHPNHGLEELELQLESTPDEESVDSPPVTLSMDVDKESDVCKEKNIDNITDGSGDNNKTNDADDDDALVIADDGEHNNKVSEEKDIDYGFGCESSICSYIILCPQCGIKYDNWYTWRDHISTVHSLDSHKTLNFTKIFDWLQECNECKERVNATSLFNLQTHKFKHLPYGTYLECRYCDAKYNYIIHIVRHLKAKHPEHALQKQDRPIDIDETLLDNVDDVADEEAAVECSVGAEAKGVNNSDGDVDAEGDDDEDVEDVDDDIDDDVDDDDDDDDDEDEAEDAHNNDGNVAGEVVERMDVDAKSDDDFEDGDDDDDDDNDDDNDDDDDEDDDDDDDDSENYGTDGNAEDPAIDSENTNVEAPNGVVEDIEQVENPEEQFVLG